MTLQPMASLPKIKESWTHVFKGHGDSRYIELRSQVAFHATLRNTRHSEVVARRPAPKTFRGKTRVTKPDRRPSSPGFHPRLRQF